MSDSRLLEEAAALLCQLNTVTEIIRLEMRAFFLKKGQKANVTSFEVA